MNVRLHQIIDYKTQGRRGEFADMCGWSQPYLSKLLRGESIGIAPIRTILATFPEIDARWLLLGEGKMLRKV
ncbi:MAG: hypothetical protein IIW91_07775 [Alistipes sp.]|nr:hypothetical protein [Alistipes sp.]